MKSSFTPGGYCPWKYPITATTLGSLIVQAHPIRSPRCAAARVTYRAKQSGASGASQPPRAANHKGVVKWWKVTTGRIPRPTHAAQIRR